MTPARIRFFLFKTSIENSFFYRFLSIVLVSRFDGPCKKVISGNGSYASTLSVSNDNDHVRVNYTIIVDMHGHTGPECNRFLVSRSVC